MARKLESQENAESPSGLYPYGRLKDDDGTGNGVPVNESVYGDIHQFFARLFALSGLSYNQQPDNSYNGWQFIEALLKKVVSSDDAKGIKIKEINIGAWNMYADKTKVLTSTEGLTDSMVDNLINIKIKIYTDGSSGPSGTFLDYVNEVADTGLMEGGISEIVGGGFNQIVLYRRTNGFYDSTTYNDPSQNRGVAYIMYWG